MDSSWTQRGVDIDGDATNDRNGYWVSLSADGDTVAMGAKGNDDSASNAGHVRIYDWDGSSWGKRGDDIGGEKSQDGSGNSVSLSENGDTVAIGAYWNDGNGEADPNAGHVRIYDWSDDAWTQRGDDIDGEAAGDQSGISVSLSADGDRVAIGALYNDDGGSGAGHVRIYDWSDDAWTQRAVDIDGEAAGDQSGISVSLGADGDTIAIGANSNDGNGTGAGHVRVYDYYLEDPLITSSASFSATENQTAVGTVTAGDGEGDNLTFSLSGDDVGSFSIDETSGVLTFDSAPDYETKSSYVITVEVSDGTNTDSQELTISITDANDAPSITSSSTFSAAENQTAVGTITATDPDGDDLTFSLSGDDAGSFSIDSSSGVLTFDSAPDYEIKSSYALTVEVDDGTNTDSQDLTVTVTNVGEFFQRGADIDGEATSDYSGYSVSMSDDGATMAIGAYGNDGNGNNAGHVRIYDWSDDAWTQRGDDIDGEAANDNSGYSASLSEDGDTVAIGAYLNADNGSNAGHVRIYDWDGSSWTKRGDDIDGEAADDESGKSVSLSADGDTVAIGAPEASENGSSSGQVRIYNWDGSSWTQRGVDIDGDATNDRNGYWVSLSADGDTVAMGAKGNDDSASNAGHVRIYDWDGSSWGKRGDDIGGEKSQDGSGNSVSLSENGDTVAIGAYWNDGNGEADPNAGHVRIYDWSDDAWTQRGDDIDGEAAGDQSGISVSLSADGDRVAIGALYNDDGGSGGRSCTHLRLV